jgi:LuxR family maltose regulon positive regulatory protein
VDRAASGAPRPPIITDVRLPGFAAHVAYVGGELHSAEEQARAAYAAAERLGLPKTHFALAEPALVLGGLLAERGRIEEAEAYLEELLLVAEHGRRRLMEVLAHLAFAELAANGGDHASAADRLRRAREVQPAAQPPVLARIDETEARVALLAGELAVAEGAVRRLPPGPAAALLESRLALARGAPAEALDVLERPERRWPTRRQQVERCVLASLALDASGLRSQAHDVLREGLALADPVGFEHLVIGEGVPMWDLLQSLTAGGATAGYVDRLLRAASGTVVTARPSRQDDLVDPLSDREITVLRYLSSRLTAPDIASALFISGNTVRSHVKAIYRKLGVNSRADAVRHGEALGLV